MKTLRFITAGFVVALAFAVSAFAQTTGDGKLGLIDTRYFDNGKDGITQIFCRYGQSGKRICRR